MGCGSTNSKTIEFLKSKRKFLWLELVPILLLVLFKILSVQEEVYKSFEFPVLLIIIGLPLAYLLRPYLKITSMFHWYVNAAGISLLFIPFLFVLAGFLKINIVFTYSVQFLHLLALLSCLALLVIGREAELEGMRFFTEDWKFDLIAIGLIGMVVFQFTLVNFSHRNIGWDTFTFWGIDAKYIFENDSLRDATFNVTQKFHYTSLFPVLYAIVYDFFGYVVEQFATWMNIFILAIAAFQVYFMLDGRSVTAKLLGTALIMATIVGASIENIARIFNFYSDIYCAFLLLQFALYLVQTPPALKKAYGLRLFLIVLPLVALGFVKDGLFQISLIMFIIFLVHDLPIFKKGVREVVASRSFIISIGAILLLFLLRGNYFTSVQKIVSAIDTVVPTLELFSFDKAIKNLGSIIRFFVTISPVMSGIWLFQVILAIYAMTKKRLARSGYFLFAIGLLGFLYFVAGFVIKLIEIESRSLARYTTLVMFVVPLVIAFIDLETRSKAIRKVAQIFALLIMLASSLVSLNGIADHLPFYLSPGAYKETDLKEQFEVSNKVLQITGSDARVLIVQENTAESLLTNMAEPGIYYRYYLMNNSVGGQFNTLKYANLKDHAVKNGAEYVLLLSYDGIFSGCDAELIRYQEYLIEVSSLVTQNGRVCPISTEAMIPVN